MRWTGVSHARRDRTDVSVHCAVFIGHFAVGFASKRAAPRASLGVLMAAPLFLDLLWPIFLHRRHRERSHRAGHEPVPDAGPARLPLVAQPGDVARLVGACSRPRFWAATRYGRGAAGAGGGRVQPLGPGLRDAPAGHAALSRQRQVGRSRSVELPAGHDGRRDRDVRRRRRDLRRARRARSTGAGWSPCGRWSRCWRCSTR